MVSNKLEVKNMFIKLGKYNILSYKKNGKRKFKTKIKYI